MILDTNALSAMADGDRRMAPILQQAKQIEIPVVVLGEYRYGIRQSRNRKVYEYWLSQIIPDCRVLVVDDTTAERYAEVRDELRRSGRPIPSNDLWIAGLARQHDSPLLSRDRHFDAVPGLQRIDW